MYKPVLVCDPKELKAIQRMSQDNSKSAELWKDFEKHIHLIPSEKSFPAPACVDFVTVVRSTYTNKVVTLSNGLTCSIPTSEYIQDRSTTLDDLCVINAFKAFTSVVIADEGTIESLLMQSAPQTMGVLYHEKHLTVYMNVVVDDVVVDLYTTGAISLCDRATFTDISEFKPVHGSIDELTAHSLIVISKEGSK